MKRRGLLATKQIEHVLVDHAERESYIYIKSRMILRKTVQRSEVLDAAKQDGMPNSFGTTKV